MKQESKLKLPAVLLDIRSKDLPSQVPPDEHYPEVVKGRVAHIDADFLAYMVSYDASKSVEAMMHNCEVKIEKLQKQCGAESTMLHLTPKDSNKGNRYDIAIQREYQATRKGKAKPKYLHLIRDWMAKEHGAVLAHNYEADDSMAMAAYKAAQAGTPELAVICTKDKDLTAVPGFQLNWDTGEITTTENDFGYIRLDRSKKVVKIKGRGYKFFFAQLLMGDTADNIQGLPCYKDEFLTGGSIKRVGPVLAHSILDPTTSISEAFTLTKKLFKDAGELIGGYKHWKTGAEVPWNEVMLSEMKLLWMRRTDDENDVVKWLKENQ